MARLRPVFIREPPKITGLRRWFVRSVDESIWNISGWARAARFAVSGLFKLPMTDLHGGIAPNPGVLGLWVFAEDRKNVGEMRYL